MEHYHTQNRKMGQFSVKKYIRIWAMSSDLLTRVMSRILVNFGFGILNVAIGS